eukprot:scaffold163741_cov66-Cyclotella_meneghiniana.AAC.1
MKESAVSGSGGTTSSRPQPPQPTLTIINEAKLKELCSFPIHCYFPPPELGDSTVTLLVIFPGIPRNYLPNLCSLTFDLSQKEGAKRNISPRAAYLVWPPCCCGQVLCCKTDDIEALFLTANEDTNIGVLRPHPRDSPCLQAFFLTRVEK